MTITTSLFSDLSARYFNRLDGRISELQGLVASGKNDPKMSADPVRAIRLSAAQEQQELLERFSGNVEFVSSRLGQADASMDEAVNMMQRVREISLMAANDTLAPTDREALAIELRAIKIGLKDLGNARDSTGQAVFGGFRVDGNPFEVVDGRVVYGGDNGRHMLRISETATLPTAIDGGSVFMSVQTQDGATSVFDMIDDIVYALSPVSDNTRTNIPGGSNLVVDIHAGREPQNFTMSLSGPLGRAEVEAEMVEGVPGPMIDAINARSAETGITASLHSDGKSILLSSTDDITINSIETEGAQHAVLASVQDLDDDGRQYELVGRQFSMESLLDATQDAIEHFADIRAELGALGAVAEQHKKAIVTRNTEVQKAIAGLEDADIAKLVTELQSLLTTRSAAQQTFVKISQNNLFDYLR